MCIELRAVTNEIRSKRISNIEQGMSNDEGFPGYARLTSTFIIPCSIFDIHLPSDSTIDRPSP